ncbi:RecB-like helicase [Hydrogenimonas thermophila]|uniref:DNA 3'-5' helicase n=1 Tax=Hydrogenimonas thermophila TaxID=223786 RepID=A0A1I5PEK9_9BACT|nr:RecB-like helicase [Hydrogenimonas thermophila]SFP32562.1 ATP-dependent exoDNAse (exonuclease V) beta subunit (contains helicase and exonuclease domains) [Hydrogenimonas thermophila]
MQRLYALSASAGSGKTFALVARYLSLLFLEAKPSEILAITFTNKAAGEMRERVQSFLQDMPEAMVQEVANMSGLSLQEIEKKRPTIFHRFLKSDLKVMTIDKFIHQVLRKFCWYVGLQSDFTVEAQSQDTFFERFLEELEEKEYFSLINFARFEAQKRQNIATFFELLYEKDKEIPSMSFSVEPYSEEEAMKWAFKLKEFVLNGNFSSTAKRMMDYECLSEVIEKSWFGRETLNYRTFSKGFIDEMDVWLHNLYRETAHYYNRKEEFFLDRIFKLYKAYRNSKQNHLKISGKLHFKDIEHLVFELLRQKDFTNFLYFRLDSQIGHILFDEFQDTSVTQYRIFEPIIEEIATSESERTFFYVGDTKQSIYRFRGGQKELFTYVADSFNIPIGFLATNYRSKREIVEFVNKTFPYVKPPQKAFKPGGFVEVVEDDETLESMGKSLKQLFEAGVPDEQIAILVNDNREILQVGDYILENFGKNIATHKRAKVSEQPSAKALIELMKLIYANSSGKQGNLHRLNFLSLIGKPYDETFKPDIALRRPALMIKEAMQKYKFFDEASFKLLEFAIPLHDLTEFVYEIDNYEEELPAKDVAGINVLTIHKSKGLEFEHVIVLDRLGRGQSDTSPVIFDYEGIALKSIRMKFKKREAIDEKFKAVIDKEKRLALEDKMNKIYVAFTRAKSSLTVIKKSKSSIFDFLNLSPQTIGRLEVEKSKKTSNIQHSTFNIQIKDYGRQKVSSSIETYKANDFEAIFLGLGVHYLFETDDEDAFLNRYGGMCDKDKALSLVQAGKANIEYMMITEGKKVYEMPYVYEGIPGVIDLFVENGEQGVIIDYKTSTPSDKQNYILQIKRYKEALHRLKPELKEIEAYLYYLDKLELVKI